MAIVTIAIVFFLTSLKGYDDDDGDDGGDDGDGDGDKIARNIEQ